MSLFLILAFLFFVGSTIGWVIELFYRRFFTAKKWINPGFLVGPWLPLYGFGLVLLYYIASIDFPNLDNSPWNTVVHLLVMVFLLVLIEYIAGLIFIKGMHIKLWDYSNRWGNIQGIICPLFTLFWVLVAAGYYFLIHPYIVNALTWLANHLSFSFVVGFFYGLLAVDIVYSFKLSARLRKLAIDNNIIIRYEELKATIRDFKDSAKEKIHFLLPFKSDKSLKELLIEYKNRPKKNYKKEESEENNAIKN